LETQFYIFWLELAFLSVDFAIDKILKKENNEKNLPFWSEICPEKWADSRLFRGILDKKKEIGLTRGGIQSLIL
jgi:hypothetical protein